MSKKRVSFAGPMSGADFDALPAVEKERIYQELDSKTTEQLLTESRPLNASQRATWRRIRKKMGRPRIGRGTTNVSVTLEKDLLRQADRYAKAHGMSRSQLLAEGVRAILGSAA